MKTPDVYLRHIQGCIQRIHEQTSGGRDDFMSSTLIQDATLRNLQVLAESTQRLPVELKGLRPEIPWDRIAGFRNVLVHNYLGIDVGLVWDTVIVELPTLLIAVEALLDELQRRKP